MRLPIICIVLCLLGPTASWAQLRLVEILAIMKAPPIKVAAGLGGAAQQVPHPLLDTEMLSPEQLQKIPADIRRSMQNWPDEPRKGMGVMLWKLREHFALELTRQEAGYVRPKNRKFKDPARFEEEVDKRVREIIGPLFFQNVISDSHEVDNTFKLHFCAVFPAIQHVSGVGGQLVTISRQIAKGDTQWRSAMGKLFEMYLAHFLTIRGLDVAEFNRQIPVDPTYSQRDRTLDADLLLTTKGPQGERRYAVEAKCRETKGANDLRHLMDRQIRKMILAGLRAKDNPQERPIHGAIIASCHPIPEDWKAEYEAMVERATNGDFTALDIKAGTRNLPRDFKIAFLDRPFEREEDGWSVVMKQVFGGDGY